MHEISVAASESLNLVQTAAHLSSLGLSPGRTGNISLRTGDLLVTSPTNADLADLDPEALSVTDLKGNRLAGPKPTKELPLHCALYERLPESSAVIHLHSAFSTALSCLPSWMVGNALPPVTPYVVMKVGDTPLIPYAPPGSPELARRLLRWEGTFRSALLANHGLIVAGPTMLQAVESAIQLEEAAKLTLLLRGQDPTYLSTSEVEEIRATFVS